jgi:hypothetical protein
MRRAIRGISESYRPFARQTGAVRQTEQVAQDLGKHFQTIDRLAPDISLSQRAWARIEKARPVVSRMVATISLVHATIRSWVEQFGLPEDETTAAERLTGHPPTDLIQWLLERIPPD